MGSSSPPFYLGRSEQSLLNFFLSLLLFLVFDFLREFFAVGFAELFACGYRFYGPSVLIYWSANNAGDVLQENVIGRKETLR